MIVGTQKNPFLKHSFLGLEVINQDKRSLSLLQIEFA